METRDSLLCSLRARLRRLAEDHDVTAVLSEEALTEARALMTVAPEPPANLEVLTTVGCLHWFRCQAMGPGSGQRDLRAAVLFLAPVYHADPGAVPGPVRRFFAEIPPEQLGPEAMVGSVVQMMHRSRGAGSLDPLDEAIGLLRQVIAALPGGHPGRVSHLFALDDALERRFELTGSMADIDEAVEVSRKAVAAIPPQDRDHASALSNLGNALGTRFGRTADPADLDEAIEAERAAEVETSQSHPARPQMLSNLGANLLARFTQDHRRGDLDEAIKIFRQAAELIPRGHPGRPSVLSNLGNALAYRSGQPQEPADLDEGIEFLREATAALSPPHPQLPGLRLNLGAALRARFDRDHRPSDLGEAIDSYRHVAAAGDSSAQQFAWAGLARALTARYVYAGDVADLAEAVAAQRRATVAAPSGSPDGGALDSVPDPVPGDGNARLRYRRYTRAMLSTRMEMWRRTGNPEWLAEDRAHNEAFALLGSALSEPRDADAAMEAAQFLVARATATEGARRSEELAEIVSLLGFLQASGIAVEVSPPDPASTPEQRRAAAPLPDLTALRSFAEQFRHTPTPLATGELALSRVDEYGEVFFAGMDALIFMHGLLGETSRVKRLTSLKEYLQIVKQQTGEHGTEEFRKDLVWGQALEDVEQFPADRDNRAEMDERISVLRRLIQRMPQGSRNRAARLSQLATVLRQRFQRSGRLDDLDECIGVQREAVHATAAGSTARGDMLADLGLLYKTRFERRMTDAGPEAAGEDLDEAIEVGRASLQQTPPGYAWRANRLGAHATLLLRRFELGNAAADLDEAMTSLEEAVGAERVGDGERERLWGLLAWARVLKAPPGEEATVRDPRAALRERMQRFRQVPDVQGIELLQSEQACDELLAALAGCAGPSDLESDLQLLADAINFLRFRSLRMGSGHADGEMEISQTVEHHLEQLQEASGAELAAALPQVAREALTRLRNLWRRPAPMRAADRWGAYRDLLKELGGAWPPSGLDEKITRLRGVLQRAQPGSAYLSALHSELGIALWERFQHEGSHADIGESLEHLIEASKLLDPRDPDYAREVAGRMLNIGTAALTLGERTHKEEMLSTAVNMLRNALEFFPPGSDTRIMGLSNLGMALQFRYSLTGAPADVTDAIAALREAARDTSDMDPDLPGILTNLCMALCSSYELTLSPEELQDAIEAGQSALAMLPLDSGHQARLLANVGVCYEKQFRKTGSAQARTQAMTYFEQAARSEASPVWDRIRPARGWGLLAAGAAEYSVAADALGYVVELLPTLAWHGLGMADRLSYLGSEGMSGLPSEAAACAIADGRPDRALQLLEHGRGVLLSQVLNLRTDLSALDTVHPDLAQELDTVRSRLDNAEETDRESRRDLAHRWDQLVSKARGLPGFSGFLLPPRLETLLPAAAAGPVITVNVSTRRCDALLLTGEGIRLRELPGLTAEAVSEQVSRYLSVLQEAERTAAESFSAREMASVRGTPEATRRYVEAQRERAAAHRAMEHTLGEVMAWLWETVAEPVLTTLGFDGPPPPDRPWPRLWWCPTGTLSLLPLHAAAHRGADGRRDHRAVLDRVISSYTPTLRALTQARQHRERAGAADRFLVVALPETPGQAPLPHVSHERDVLAALFPGDRHTLLEGERATRNRVSQELARHRWAHLSCHGDQDLTQPLQGGLLLYDGVLTFGDVAGHHHNGEYAFLSACKTATGGIRLADEVVAVASALHYTGYRHVIASSWSVLGSKAADLAEAVYADLSSDGAFSPDRAAWALHRGIRMLRDRHPSQPSVWMPFTHTGP